MIRWFRLFVDEIKRGENLELYLIVAIAFVVAVLDVVEVAKFEIVSAAILMTLSLIAGSLLASRRSTNELKKVSEQLGLEFEALRRDVRGTGRISKILREGYPDLSKEFESATSICVLGTTLSSTISRHYHDLEQALKRGCNLRVLTSEPTPEVLKMMAYASYWAEDAEEMKGNVDTNLSRANRLFATTGEPGFFRLRTIPYTPSYGMIWTEKEDGTSKAFVKVMSFRRKGHPCFEVNSQTDVTWFRFFTAQYEEYWSAAAEFSLKGPA